MKADNNKSVQPARRFVDCITRVVPIAWWPVLATLLVHGKVLFHPIFMFDDFVHLYNVSNLPFLDAIRVTFGGHLIHSFTTVVWLVKSLFGVNPLAFMLLGVVLHLANVRLLFEIISRLTARQGLAALGASLWGMSPFAAGTLGWISVHGQIYATAAILWVLLDVVRYSQAPSLLKSSLLVRHAVLLLVAFTSFGSGLSSTAVFALVIAVWNPLPAYRTRLIVVYGSVALVAIAFYVFSWFTESAMFAGFNHTTAILTQSLDNIEAISRAFAGLMSIGFAGLFWGPLLIGKIALVPIAALPSVAMMAALFTMLPLLVWGCVWSRPMARRQIFALLILPCAAYGLIAIARTSFMAKVLVITPRYHYLSMAIFSIVLCLLLSALIDRLPQRAQRYGSISFAIWLALAIMPFAVAPADSVTEIGRHNQDVQYKQSMREIQTAIEKSTGQETIYIVNKPYRVTPKPMRIFPEYFPGLAALFVMSYPSNIVDGKRVLFLETSEDIVDMTKAQKGTRISELITYAPTPAK
jgi:hypothetical protein